MWAWHCVPFSCKSFWRLAKVMWGRASFWCNTTPYLLISSGLFCWSYDMLCQKSWKINNSSKISPNIQHHLFLVMYFDFGTGLPRLLLFLFLEELHMKCCIQPIFSLPILFQKLIRFLTSQVSLYENLENSYIRLRGKSQTIQVVINC